MSGPGGTRRVERAGLAWWEAEALTATGRFAHAFTTRRGGVSEAEYGGLDLGYGSGDDPERVGRNRRLLLEALGLGGRPFVAARQVHGDELLVIRGAADAQAAADRPADGLLTASPEVAVAVLTADCLAVLLADPERGAVAAVHAGWRGAAQRIAGKAVRRMADEFGCRPASLLVALGPCVGPCCYEVDAPVLERFAAAFPGQEGVYARPRGGGKALLDLAAAVRLDLKETGIKDENVTVIGQCTACQPGEFYSYRRNGPKTGRLAAVIGLMEGTTCREERGP